MKFKKLLAVILVVVTVFSVSSFAVSAQTTVNSGVAVTATSNYLDEITYRIRLAIVEQLVEATNRQIEALVNQAINHPNPDINKLVATTNALAQATIQVASLLGITVVCEYVPYVIHGQTVYIDPLIVIKR